MPARSDSLVPGVEVCRDARGDLLAYCHADDGTLRVDMPGLASFHHERGAGHVRAVPHGPLSPAFILDTYHHCVLPLILPALGTEVLHASAVRGPAGVVALCGESGTGKSTIAVALARRGHALWADDAVAVDLAGPGASAVPLPFTVRLRPDSARFLGRANGASGGAAAGEGGAWPAGPGPDTTPAPLAALCFLRRIAAATAEPSAVATAAPAMDATADAAVERLDPASACRAALAHAYCFSVEDPARKRRTVERYLALVARVPAWEIRFRPGLERLPALLDAIEGVTGGVPSEAR